ncbi:MAG: CAP domain-containing protein [Aggregatilineales bacterium]
MRIALAFTVVLAFLSMLLNFQPTINQQVTVTPFPTATPNYFHDRQAEMDVLTDLNHWRIRRGLAPLMVNQNLSNLALDQAQYMVQFAPFTTQQVDFHTDRYGESIVQRAQLADWQGYEYPGQVLVAEVAAYYPDVNGVIGFWQSSLVHSRTIQNGGYREAGIAVLNIRGWLLSYVVLGGRPDVLPVLYDPNQQMLYLTLDQSGYSNGFTPDRIRIINSDGAMLHPDDWMLWARRIPLPYGATNQMTIIYSDGIQEIATVVDLDDVVIFPAEAAPTLAPSATASPSATPLMATFTPRPPLSTPTATIPPRADGYDINFVYDSTSLTMMNDSNQHVDLSPLRFVAPSLNFSRTGTWLGRYAEVDIENFPANYCMQAWSFLSFNRAPPLPQQCNLLASGRSILQPNQRFWLVGHFNIYYGQELVASCTAEAGVCGFDMP